MYYISFWLYPAAGRCTPRQSDHRRNHRKERIDGRRESTADYLLVRHKVRDFSEWKSGYEEHLPKRKEAGLKEKHVLRSGNDSNEVVALFEVSDRDRAKAFTESTELREVMQKVGVIDKPDIYFLSD